MQVTDEKAKNNFAASMQRLMITRGISQSEIARAIGESDARIHNYKNAVKMPGIGVATRIAEFFGVSVDSMLSGESEKKAKKSKIPA